MKPYCIPVVCPFCKRDLTFTDFFIICYSEQCSSGFRILLCYDAQFTDYKNLIEIKFLTNLGHFYMYIFENNTCRLGLYKGKDQIFTLNLDKPIWLDLESSENIGKKIKLILSYS